MAPSARRNPEFAAAIADELGENTVQAGDYHQHRHPRECSGEIETHARTEIALVDGLLHGLEIIQSEVRCEFVKNRAHRWGYRDVPAYLHDEIHDRADQSLIEQGSARDLPEQDHEKWRRRL